MNPQTLTDVIEVHRRHIELHQTREAYLEHELALARASSDYWRAKYIAMNHGSKEYVSSTRNALYWYNASLQNASPFMRSPMDECDE